jgi:hypothetical protein
VLLEQQRPTGGQPSRVGKGKKRENKRTMRSKQRRKEWKRDIVRAERAVGRGCVPSLASWLTD